MASTLKLPVGIENFEEIRKLGFYYIDKTRLIEQLLQGWGKVTLFTRPRRFGKTLNMSMLKSFFEIGTDKTLFEGLYISGNKELCDEHMGKYPVIFLSFKGVEGLEFASAKRMLCTIIDSEIDRHYYLKTSDVLTDEDRTLFTKMLHGQADISCQIPGIFFLPVYFFSSLFQKTPSCCSTFSRMQTVASFHSRGNSIL